MSLGPEKPAAFLGVVSGHFLKKSSILFLLFVSAVFMKYHFSMFFLNIYFCLFPQYFISSLDISTLTCTNFPPLHSFVWLAQIQYVKTKNNKEKKGKKRKTEHLFLVFWN